MSTDELIAALPFRLRRVEDVQGDLVKWRGVVDTERAVQKEQLGNLREEMNALTAAVDSLRKVILGFALSIAGSAVVFALSVLIATGKIGG